MSPSAYNEAAEAGESEPIAIVGMGCRLPGGVRDIPGLWDFLREEKNGFKGYEDPLFNAEGFYHPNPERPGTAAASGGFLLDEDARLFDPSFFGITDIEVETLDAAQRKLLEVTYEAFENAGETWESVSGSQTGVFIGDICFDNYLTQTRDWEYSGKYSATGSFPNMLANRLHYIFNLKGPSVLINSACTSAMYGLHLAITSMRNGDCDSAIVAGSNWIMDPNCHIAMGKLGALSATSKSRTFDASADGYARGEGYAALYLKKASQAVQDGSPIRALVMGTAVNANGRTNGITNPSGIAQEAVIKQAYQNAGNLDPSQTTYLECHGTGTRVGDPIEVMAAGNVFGPGRSDSFQDRLIIGSVKTNMGHLEGACALAGILKVVTSLEAGEIPATLGLETLNPRIDFDKAKAHVANTLIPWPKNKMRRAGVTSAGFGGTNGHCIIDHVHNVMPGYVKPGIVHERLVEINSLEPNGNKANGIGTNGFKTNGVKHTHSPVTAVPNMTMKPDAETRQLVLLPFSAHNETSLQANMDALSSVLHRHSLADVAYTLAVKRSRFSQRAFRIVDKDEVAAEAGLHANHNYKNFYAPPKQISIGFVFTGQGAQWHEMGAELFEYRAFRTAIAYLDGVLGMLPEAPSWKITDALSGKCVESFVQLPAVSQTVCTALQIGLVDLLASWSIKPAGIIGHSSGEMAAAYAAGRITAAEAIIIAYFRGVHVARNKKKGAMLAVGLGPEDVAHYLTAVEDEGKIGVAAINSPNSITLSGEANAIEAVAAKLNESGVFNRLLNTGGLAYHSHHMADLGGDYVKAVSSALESLEEVGTKYPSVPWFSSVSPSMNTTKEINPSYWRANLESPVRFSEAAVKLLSSESLGIGALVEIGPHAALKNPLGQIIKSLGSSIPYTGSLSRNEDARRSLLSLAGTLFGLNADVNLVAVNAIDNQHGCTAVDLPPYQYTYGPINYHESRISKEFRLRKEPRHDLLGAKVPGTAKLRPQWRNMVVIKDLPWLNDHRVPPHVLFPGAAHIINALVAAEQSYREFPDAQPITGFTLRNVSIKKTLVVPEDHHGIEIILSMELDEMSTAKVPGWSTFSIASVVRDSDQWTEHCTGSVKVEVSTTEPPAPIDMTMDARPVDAQVWYRRFADLGLEFGPSFQGYSDVLADPAKNLASAKIALKTTEGMFPGGESSYPLHPTSLDLVIRLGLIAANGGQAETASVQLPIHLDTMRLKTGHHRSSDDWAIALSCGEQRGLRGAYSQLQMLDRSGNVALDLDNLQFTSLNNEQNDRGQTKAFASPYTRLVWRPDIRTMNPDQCRALFLSHEEARAMAQEGEYPQISKLFDLLGHVNPDLRVLEVNQDGDTAASRTVLKTLVGANGIKRYREYVMTNILQAELGAMQESVSEFRDVSCSVLDIEKDTLEQGFSPIYDVVLATRSSSVKTVENCKKLLKPGGKLVLVECKDTESQNGDKGYTNGHSFNISSWDTALRGAGFESGAEITLDDYSRPNKHSTVIVSTLPLQDNAPNGTRDSTTSVVYLLHGAKGPPSLLKRLAQEMENRGDSPNIIQLDSVKDFVTPDSRVVAFLDGENLLLSADQNRLGLFQHLAGNTASMIWITSCGIVKGRNPDGAFVAGLLRVLSTENPSGQFLSVDLDAEDFDIGEHDVENVVRCLADQELALQHQERDSESEVNREFSWQEGCMWVSRLVPDAGLQEHWEPVKKPAQDDSDLKMMPLDSQGPIRAAFATPGILSSLYFRPYTELLQPVPRDFIEVKVSAVGLNWKDLGLSSGRFDGNNLSSEYCGTITKKGSDVNNFEVGDRVYGMGKGHFGNYTRVLAAVAQKLRPSDDSAQMATMPLVYMTVVYAFEHITRLRKGQKVLIQSASGGLGLAAIQLARSKGAEIFVTAGNADKARFLAEETGIPSTHIFFSRNTADLWRSVKATKNGGFDVILSTAAGDGLYESLKALAPLGHLIDVGRMDVTSSKNVSLELFQKSAGFTSFDLGLVIDRDPMLGGDLMKSVDDHYRAGRIGPLQPYIASDVSELSKVLLRFSKGTHIGKLVITYQNPESLVKMHRPSAPAVRFDSEARYIITGGLSGLGRAIVRWMCDRGAKDFVVFSRQGTRNASQEALDLIDMLATRGIRIRLIACDVSKREQVMSAVQDACSDRQVRGVVNFAVSYEDISFDKMTEDKFHLGMAAKILGTKNLHEATASLPLDFFIMTSSLGTVYAFPTQSTYTAANNWLDYFARYRRRCGLPASTLSLGFITDMGNFATDPATVNMFVRIKAQTITANQVLRLLEPAFANKSTGIDAGKWLGKDEDPLSEANIFTSVDPVALAALKRENSNKPDKMASSSLPRWFSDARVSLIMRAFDDAWRHSSGEDAAGLHDVADSGGKKSPAAVLRHQFDMAIKKIKLMPEAASVKERATTVSFVTDAIVTAVAGMVFLDKRGVNPSGTVAEHGVDSLLAAEFRSWLKVAFGKNISMLDLMDARMSINALGASVVDEATGK